MKWQEQRMSKTRSRGGKGSKGFFLCFFCSLYFICFLTPVRAEEQKSPSSASEALTELEALQGENLQLKYDSLDKQMRLMQAQYQQLQAQQAEIIGQLHGLEAAILRGRSLKPGEWSVNWQESKIQKSEARSQKPEGE